MELPKIKIYDEKDKILHQVSKDVSFPVSKEDRKLAADTIKYLKECKKYYEYKEKQRPIIEANKAYEKQKRKFLQEVKMSKEKPTKKQLYYYDRLCKKYGLEKIELTSKLEARNEIDKIITEHQAEYKINLEREE